MSIADKLTTIAENEQKVYDAGKQAEYDEFWDIFQDYGNRRYYIGFLSGYTPTTLRKWFKPKYDLKPLDMQYFLRAGWDYSGFDFAQLFDELGVKLDTSRCQNFSYAFQHGMRWGCINMSQCTNTSNNTAMFYNGQLTTIDKLIVSKNTKIASSAFQECTKLANLTMEGVLGYTLSLSACPLTVESAKSIINCLYDYSGTSNELSYTLTLKSTVWTALNEAEASPNGDTWQLYVNSLGWKYA